MHKYATARPLGYVTFCVMRPAAKGDILLRLMPLFHVVGRRWAEVKMGGRSEKPFILLQGDFAIIGRFWIPMERLHLAEARRYYALAEQVVLVTATLVIYRQ